MTYSYIRGVVKLCGCFAYKRVRTSRSSIDIGLDVYPPAFLPSNSDIIIPKVPAVVYFHGGGLSVGNRRSWFPSWLQKCVTSAGYVFISADYQLVPPATGREIIADIQDLLDFIISDKLAMEYSTSTEESMNSPLPPVPPQANSVKFKVDGRAIAVAGSSAGGLCAYLAAMHCASTKLRAVVSLYGMGGNFLASSQTQHYLLPKKKPFFLGREILDPQPFSSTCIPSTFWCCSNCGDF